MDENCSLWMRTVLLWMKFVVLWMKNADLWMKNADLCMNMLIYRWKMLFYRWNTSRGRRKQKKHRNLLRNVRGSVRRSRRAEKIGKSCKSYLWMKNINLWTTLAFMNKNVVSWMKSATYGLDWHFWIKTSFHEWTLQVMYENRNCGRKTHFLLKTKFQQKLVARTGRWAGSVGQGGVMWEGGDCD